MKLLLFTQIVDKDNHFLGFFHKWIEEIAKRVESVTVICLYKGKYDLPKNVKVLSLGKENLIENESKIKSRLIYIKNFYYHIWNEIKNYDKVFVHMNQEYVILGSIFWKIFNKDVFMWRNHYIGNILTDISALFCKNVFCTSKYSYTAKYSKTKIMPVGVDSVLFMNDSVINKNINRRPKSILSFGRISPSKNIHILIDAFIILKNRNIDFTADIYGDALAKDIGYLNDLKKKVNDKKMDNRIVFYEGVPHSMASDLYYSHEIFINPSKSGMYDKMIFEAMICDCLLLSSNEDLKENIDNDLVFEYNNSIQIADKIEKMISYSDDKKNLIKKDLKLFANKHSLNFLMDRIISEIL